MQDTVRSARDAVEKVREGTSSGAGDIARGLSDAVKSGLSQVTSTPINPDQLGPHRRFETLRMNLKEVKAVKNQLGGTVNDVVLTVLTGACRSYLARRGVNLTEVVRFRALVPANMRATTTANGEDLGNRVAFMLPNLPIDESDPIKRHKRVCAETQHHKKESHELAGGVPSCVVTLPASRRIQELGQVAFVCGPVVEVVRRPVTPVGDRLGLLLAH